MFIQQKQQLRPIQSFKLELQTMVREDFIITKKAFTWVFSRESTSTMCSPTSVSINDNFPSSQPCVSFGAANYKLA